MSQEAKLRWRCRRGMKELDVVLLAFLERRYPQVSESEQRIFEGLLDLQDPQLYAYITGRERPADPAIADVVDQISRALKA
ncbi:MAG: succinate dehydrogenase assembly factor 2 [Candidatus Competibacteraceae bacterium]|nr:succinate dehydrogenase assembly factor 2 [Candidatus Competibacteraceae bacterium]